MTNLNNIPSTSAEHSRAPAPGTSISQGINKFYSCMGISCLNPPAAISERSDADDMRAPSNRLQIKVLKFNTNSWKKILNDWINEPQTSSVEESGRKIAGRKIKDCIRTRGRILDLSGLSLSSLPAILHHCKALRNFNCDNNQLTQLNLEGCKTLTDLICNHNQLTQLNLEDCKALEILNCRNNSLTQLKIEGCKKLQNLVCTLNNQLEFDHLNFLLEMGSLRHIECSNTAIGWHQFPEAIRNNQDIFIDIRPRHERPQALNNAQNTHTGSIHQCASQNAKALKENNSTQNLEQAYSDFCTWIKHLPTKGAAIKRGYANTAFKHKAAKEWIADPRHLEHKDETSRVSVKEFLALAWLAAQDPRQREPHVSEADAKEALVNALYEIRRGYNLDDAHNPKDNGAPARNICAGGTFNKISEKLVSVIQGVVSVMVTTETFISSLTNSIKNAVEILRGDKNSGVEDELNENSSYLTENVWKKVEAGVIASIREEFKNYPEIAGKDLDEHIREQTNFETSLQYLNLK